MSPVRLAQAFLFDLVVCAHLPGFLDPTVMTARARDLARELGDRKEPAVVEARRFLSEVGHGVRTMDAEFGSQARALGVALEPVAWPGTERGDTAGMDIDKGTQIGVDGKRYPVGDPRLQDPAAQPAAFVDPTPGRFASGDDAPPGHPERLVAAGSTLAAPSDQEDGTMSSNTGEAPNTGNLADQDEAGAVPNTGDAALEQQGGAAQKPDEGDEE